MPVYQTGVRKHLREGVFHALRNRYICRWEIGTAAIAERPYPHTVYLFGIYRVSVIGKLTIQVCADKHAAGKPYRQAKYIDKREHLVALQSPPRGFDVVSYHLSLQLP